MAIDTATQLPSSTAPTNQDLSKTISPQLAFNRLIRHDLITTDFDELKFRAAAARQLGFDERDQYTSAESDSRLIVSPYNTSPHLLDLNTLDTQSRLLTLALAYFRPIRDDYATADYLDSFNWDEVFHLLRGFSEVEHHTWTTQTFYVVSFRSKLQPGIDNDYLHALDAHSHQEATASGGLLKYWFGTKNEKRENLATCIWRNRNDARSGGQGPWHAKARAAGRELYEHIVFQTMKLVIENDVASWRISEWVNEEES
ncbi:hypothetical protein N7478_005253 [Penicillium angulare]|uniref:uncharacterized protein n=1 Tax=Penicillium angulare TaxID=116970 RepID=UPI002540A869|nr:uncharacterized protein N7478_005253 [Penicillium angulare]KAJ5279881.1 hypothetical protein N7478_005253 [Penicillium angulare]